MDLRDNNCISCSFCLSIPLDRSTRMTYCGLHIYRCLNMATSSSNSVFHSLILSILEDIRIRNNHFGFYTPHLANREKTNKSLRVDNFHRTNGPCSCMWKTYCHLYMCRCSNNEKTHRNLALNRSDQSNQKNNCMRSLILSPGTAHYFCTVS